MKHYKRFRRSKTGLLSLCVAAAAAGVPHVYAQDDNQIAEEVVVTGYRGSLLNSTIAKKNSVGFSDVIYSDDIGKLPSQNLAESLNRIPGVRINREVTGEGQQISVRGLNSNFTKIVLNGSSIAVASSGSLDAGNRDRQVDLDVFPPELFSSLSVNKTAAADQIEGGVSGYVNMRTLRASDLGEGQNIRFSLEGQYNDMSGDTSPKYSFTYSNSNDKFGVLLSVVGKQLHSRVDGYETVGSFQEGCEAGWYDSVDEDNNPIRARGCLPTTDNEATFFYGNVASPDFVAANPSYSVGDPLDLNQLTGLTDEQLDNFGIPYISRIMTTIGDRDTTSGLLSLEYSPSETLNLALDILRTESERNFIRSELSYFSRRNYIQYGLDFIPADIELASTSFGDFLDSGTFYSTRPWAGSRDYSEDLTFTSYMPSLNWQISDTFKMEASFARTESDFFRDEPYFTYYAPETTMVLRNAEVPTAQFSADLTNPAGWTAIAGPGIEGNEVTNIDIRFQRNTRQTETNTLRLDFSVGEDPEANGFKFGVISEELTTNSQGYDSSGYRDYLIAQGVYPEVVDNFEDYLVAPVVNDLGSSIDGYNGVTGWVDIDWSKFYSTVNYGGFNPPQGTGDQFGAVVGNISEDILSAYIEANTETEVINRQLRTNVGVRFVDTDQNVSTIRGDTNESYTRFLPSVSMVYDVAEDWKARASASRSLTRANPSDMFPSSAWNGSGVDQVRTGNPALSPFESTNFDIGGEYYFSELGYVGVNFYSKDITGFTEEVTNIVQFQELTNYGIDITDLSQTQQDQLDMCGGASSPGCTTAVVTKRNVEGTSNLTGVELIWVQPLDFIVNGLGFNASANSIDQEASDPDSEITGVSDSYNFTGFYENDSFQVRVTYFHQDGADAGNQWGLPLMSRDRSQVDFSMSYRLPVFEDNDLTITLDGYNVTNEGISTWMVDPRFTSRAYYPGATYTLGIRGTF